MRGSRLEIERMGMSFHGGQVQNQRAEKIARMALRNVHEAMAREPGVPGSSRVIERLALQPVRVSLRNTTDEGIARAVAAEIHRSLLSS